AEARLLFEREDIPIEVVSVGGTPDYGRTHEVPQATELRVGTYAYHDRATVAAGAATLDDCALHVLATVVSHPAPDRAILDAGSKTLSSDRVAPSAGEGYGLILDYPEAVIERLNEEHGVVDLSRCVRRPRIGERVRLPNHGCVVSNLHATVMVTRGGEVVESWPVAARGRTH
ncbi:MAG: D-TA family PLP-dependent enzyme, partial [Xanthobacteraceae bacterium]